MDEKNIEVKLANGNLTDQGREAGRKEEKKKDYYLHERSFGSFERSLPCPRAWTGTRSRPRSRRVSYGDAAEDAGSAEGGKENHGEGRLSRRQRTCEAEVLACGASDGITL